MSEDFKSNKNENKVNSDEMHQEQPSVSSPQSYNSQQTALSLFNDYNELIKVNEMRMTQIEAEEIVEDVLKQAINTACDILEAGISWEKILKSSSQKRFMMGHTLKSSPILREPEPDFGDSTAPFQDNIFKLIFNLQVMGCLPHHFETLQSTNPQFQSQDNEQSIPSVIITGEKGNENCIKKKLSNKSSMTSQTPSSDEFNDKLQASPSENVPERPPDQRIVSDNEQILYKGNGLPELLDSMEIPHCSYIMYQQIKNNSSKECNDISCYSVNQNVIVDCDNLKNNYLPNNGLLSSNKEAYECDNHKLNNITESQNIKAPVFTVKQGNIYEIASSETEEYTFDSRKINAELCKNSSNEINQDVSNELKLEIQENNNFDTAQLYEPESVSNSYNNFSGFHDKNSFVQNKELKSMTDTKALETVVNYSEESHIAKDVNGQSCEHNSVREENAINYAVPTKFEFNQKHSEMVSHNEIVNDECVDSNDQHIVQKLESLIYKFDPSISLKILSNPQTLISKEDFVTNTSCKSNDRESHQKSIYNSPRDVPQTSENTNILNNNIDNIYRDNSSFEIDDFNQIKDSNCDKNFVRISENAVILQDSLDKDKCDNSKSSSSISNKYDGNEYNINSHDKNHINNNNNNNNNFKHNIKDQIKIDEMPEIEDLKPLSCINSKCDENELASTVNNIEHYDDDNLACNTIKVCLRNHINASKKVEINDVLEPLSSISNSYNKNDYNNIIANDQNTDANLECNTVQVNFEDQINVDEEVEIKQYCSDICNEIINNVFDGLYDDNGSKPLQNEILANDHHMYDFDETVTDNFNDIIAGNVSNYFKDVDDANYNIIDDIKEFVHELKTLQNTLDQHEQQSIEASVMEDRLKDLQYIFNSDHESECDEQTPKICDIKPSNSSLNKSSQQNLNEENHAHTDIYMSNDNKCYNLNNNFNDVVNKNNLFKDHQFGFYAENSIPFHSETLKESSGEIKSNNEINCRMLQTKSSNGHNELEGTDLEESSFKLHCNFIYTNEEISLEQNHLNNTNKKENVLINNIKQDLECKHDIESQYKITSESVNDINKSYSHEKVENRYEDNNNAEQWLLRNCEMKNINENSQLNAIEKQHMAENECNSLMQIESDVMGLFQNRQLLKEKQQFRSEKTDEAEKIQTLNLKHESFQEIPNSEYLHFSESQGNNRKKWDIKPEDEIQFNIFENADGEQSDLDGESNNSVGYYVNGLSDDLFSHIVTLNDQLDTQPFKSTLESNYFNEAQENNSNECLDSFKSQIVSKWSAKEKFNNLNANSYPNEIDNCKNVIDKEEWGEIQSYDYLEFILDRINMKTNLMEHKLKNTISDKDSNQFTTTEIKEESPKFFDYCLKKSDIVLIVNEHTTDYSKEFRYDSESHTECKSPTTTSNIMFIPDKEGENRNFKCENDSTVSQQNFEANEKLLHNGVDESSMSEKYTKSRSKRFEVCKVSDDLQKETGLRTERNFSVSIESQNFQDLGTLHSSSIYKSNSAEFENVIDTEFSDNNDHADLVLSNSEGSSQNNILGNIPIADNYINSSFLAAETSECNIVPSNKEDIITDVNTRNILRPENNINTIQNQSFDRFWEYDGYYSKSYNEEFETHKTNEDTKDEKYKFYKEIFEKMIEEIGDTGKGQSSENIKAELSNVDLNKVKEPETLEEDDNGVPSNDKFKNGYENFEVYNRSSSDKFSGSKVYWSSVGLVVENNDDPNILPCCQQSDDNFETFMEETESGCVDLIYPEEDKKNCGVDDKFGSTSDAAVNSNTYFILNKDGIQHINEQDNCNKLGEEVTMKVKKKNKLMQRIRRFFSSNKSWSKSKEDQR